MFVIRPIIFYLVNYMNYNYSFENWCNDNERNDLLNRWDYDLNKSNPSNVGFKSNDKFFFLCPCNKHKSTQYRLYDISSGKNKTVKCVGCNSFAQNIIDSCGEDYFKKIWSNNNVDDPYIISSHSNKKIWINCLDDNSHVFQKPAYRYIDNHKCPYCIGYNLSNGNTLGDIDTIASIWSDKNSLSPFNYHQKSGKAVWWKCNNGIHDDYKRKISASYNCDFICPECSRKNTYINRRENISGLKVGELTVLDVDEEKTSINKKLYWMCLCSCGNRCSYSTSVLKSKRVKTCGDRTIHYSNSNNGNWQGGKTPKLISERTSNKYNEWRDSVYKNNWYTCQCCGQSNGINKNAHHIYNFSDHENLRYDISNGILLCDNCHSATIQTGFHYIYGVKNNTPDQLEEYINNRRKRLGINMVFVLDDYLNGAILKPNVV